MLTREQRDKRVAVARDIIAQLDREELPLKAARGTYLLGEHDGNFLEGGDLQGQVDLLQEHCHACMLGSAFLSYARVCGGVASSNVACGPTMFSGYSLDMRRVMADAFDQRTLDLMESAFEYSDFNSLDPDEVSEDDWEMHQAACLKAGWWGDQFDDPRDAARAIATLLIKNDGEFVLPAAEGTSS